MALDHETSFCVTAGAGTGKTRVLVEKYIDILDKKDDVGVPNILAITFTEKAAAEMKTRIRERLREEKGAKWEKIRQDLVFSEISTIHSFCAGVVKRFPIEAGVLPGFDILDEHESSRVLAEAWDDLLYSGAAKDIDESLVRVLAVLDLWRTRKTLGRLVEKRRTVDAFFASLDLRNDETLSKWRELGEERQRELVSSLFKDESLLDAIKNMKELAGRYPGSEDKGMQYLREVEPLLDGLSSPNPIEVIVQSLLGLYNAKGAKSMGNKKNWDECDLGLLRESYKFIDARIAKIAPLLDLGLEDSGFLKLTLAFLRDLAIVFKRYLEIVEALERERGALSFDDLLLLTLRLLDTHPEAADYFSNRFRYVLVDEFQDIDPVQSEIIWRIIGLINKRTERLFIVGDPKQSIYLFRDADVTLFKKTQEKIVQDLKGKTVYLDCNFRSVPQIVEFVNHLFSSLLAAKDKPWEFGYERIETSEGRSRDCGTIEILLSPDADRKEQTAMSEAESVAAKIKAIVETEKKNVYRAGKEPLDSPRPAAYGDIAILLRRRTNLRYFEWAMGRLEIPYHVHGGLGFYERQEIKDIYNLLSFLENELDDAALYGVLRSPYFGVSDAHLYRAHKKKGSTYWQKFRSYVSETNEPSLRLSVMKLIDWLSIAHMEPVPNLLCRIFRESGIYAVYGGLDNGDQIIANVEKFAAIARSAECAPYASLTDFLSFFQILIDESPIEGEAQLGIESGDNVKVMTVHAAKGLEFPIVVVPDLGSRLDHPADIVLIDEKYGIGLKLPDPNHNYEMRDTLHRSLILPVLKEKTDAEERRLFYVACTRAQDHLILAGVNPNDPAKTIAEPKSRMDWLVSRLQLDTESIGKGTKEIVVPGGEPEHVSIGISVDSQLPREVVSRKRSALPSPTEEQISPLPMPGDFALVEVPKEEPVFSPTEMEDYLRCPQMYYRRHIVGIKDRAKPLSTGQTTALAHGLIVHEILEGKKADLIMKHHGITKSSESERYEVIEKKFLKSEMMSDLVEDYRELPFTAKVGGFWFDGKMDRLVKKRDRSWVIVDYKTDAISASEAAETVEDYGIQLFVYEKAAEQIVRSEVKSYCYFTNPGVFQERQGEDARLLKTISDVATRIVNGTFTYPQCGSCKRRQVPHGMRGICPALGLLELQMNH